MFERGVIEVVGKHLSVGGAVSSLAGPGGCQDWLMCRSYHTTIRAEVGSTEQSVFVFFSSSFLLLPLRGSGCSSGKYPAQRPHPSCLHFFIFLDFRMYVYYDDGGSSSNIMSYSSSLTSSSTYGSSIIASYYRNAKSGDGATIDKTG